MPLTHVCVWDSRIGYRRVTIDEASVLYPYEVPSNSGHFVCELCAQNVGLSKARIDTGNRYFFHSSASQNKECEDRQNQLSNATNQRLISLTSHSMPFRISVKASTFTLEIGFFNPPSQKAYCEKIKIATDGHRSFEYNFDRIEKVGTTYLGVGSIPSRVYGINYLNASAELKQYWATKVTGIESAGSLFDARTGHILLPGAKAYSSNSYYLLQPRQLSIYSGDLEVTEVSRVQTDNFSTWYLYKVNVKQFSARAAKFFLGYSIFLTEKPSKFYPIWPTYISDPHFIYHNSNNFYFYLCGDDAELKSYPASSAVLGTHDGKLYKLFTREREQLISLGKSGALGFSYLIKQPLTKTATLPTLVIRDSAGVELPEAIYTKIPKSKYISVACQFDGKAVVQKNGKTVSIYRISPEQVTIIDNLLFGTEISFYQGCDCVRKIAFNSEPRPNDTLAQDQEFVNKLKSCRGTTIPIAHSFGAVANKFLQFPQTRQWICDCVRGGKMSRSAYRLLLSYLESYKHPLKYR